MNKFFLFALFISFHLFAKDQAFYGDVRVSKLISIYDGDTFKVDIDEYPPIIGKNILVRIASVDCPEINSKDSDIKLKAYQAKIFSKNFLENGKNVTLKNMKRDKYFRIVADVIVDGKNLGDELLKNKLALPYNGNKKPKWIFSN